MVVYKFNPFTGTLDLVSEEDLSGYVPYTGATGDVDLGVHGLTATNLSGVLTDGVTATTQSTGDDSTKVATTAFVLNEAEIREHYDVFIDADGTGDYTSIATAVATEPVDATFFIRGGTYTLTENIVVKAGQQLIGESKETVIIDQDLTTYKISVTSAPNAVLKNFSLINGRNLAEQLDVHLSDNVVLEEIYMDANRTEGLPAYVSGLMIDTSHDCVLNNIYIKEYLYNFKIEYSDRTRISNIHSNDAQLYGIRFRGAEYTAMTNFTSYYDGSAVYFRNSNYAVITNVAVQGAIYGFYFYSGSPNDCKHNTITNMQGTCFSSFVYFGSDVHTDNTFIGVDLVVPVTVRPNNTKFIGCNMGDITIIAGADGTLISGSSFLTLTDSGTNTSVSGSVYTNLLNALNQNTPVSIGTETLDDRLFIFGAGYVGATNLILGNNSENAEVFKVLDNGDTTIAGDLTVDTNTLVVNKAGYTDKVGIGTATPVTELQVIGTVTSDGLTIGQDELITIGANTLTNDGTNFVFDDGIVATGLDINGNADISGNLIGLDNATSTNIFSDTLTVDTNTLVVNKAGYTDKVGIGTNIPDSKLNIRGQTDDYREYAFTARSTHDFNLLRLRCDGQIDISDLGLGDVKLFQNSPDSTTSKLSIYGFVNHDQLRSLDISLDPGKDDTALFDGVGTYTFDGAILGNTNLYITASGNIGTGLTVNSTKVSTGDFKWYSDNITDAVLFDATGDGEAEFNVPVSIDGITKIGDGGTTNYTEFEADGTLEFNGTATVWDDLQFPLSGAKVPASNAPNWETFTANTNEYAFTVDDYIDTQANEIPHWWKEGTAGNVHLHVTTKAANATGSDRFAKFTIYTAYCDTGETWQETSFTQELTIPDGTSALEMFYLDMGDLTLTNYIIGAEIKLRVKRIAATGGTEYAGSIFLTQAGVHLEADTVGSRTETIK